MSHGSTSARARPATHRDARTALWVRRPIDALALGALLLLGVGWVAGCESAPASDLEPSIVALGPLRADGAGRRLEVDYAVYDREGDPIDLALTWCAAGQRCGSGACAPTGLAPTVRGSRDPLDLEARTLTWKLACVPELLPAPDVEFGLCLETTGAEAGVSSLALEPTTFAALGVSAAGQATDGPLPPESCP